MKTPHRTSTPARALPRRGFTLVELLTVIAVIGILAGILIPVTSGAITAAKKAKTMAFLNTLVNGCSTYQTTYRFYPTLTSGSPGQDFALNLGQQGQTFINVMSGNISGSEKQFNKRGDIFISFSDEQLGPNGTSIRDAFRNDNIIIIMDTDNNGQIAGVNQTMSVGNSEDGYEQKSVSVTQSSPVFSRVIAMSPGRGLTNDDAVTTWEVKP